MSYECTNPLYVRIRTSSKGGRWLSQDNSELISARCGKCLNCLKYKQREWIARLSMELAVSSTAYFITFTQSDENMYILDGVPSLDRNLPQLFMDRLRRRLNRFCDKNNIGRSHLRFFLVGEYGRLGNRPHWHMVLYNLPITRTFDAYRFIEEEWEKGFVRVELVTHENIRYITKYLTKIDPRPHLVKPYISCSKKPPLGSGFFEKYPSTENWIKETGNCFIQLQDGYRYPLSRCFKKRLLTVEQVKNLVNFVKENKVNEKELQKRHLNGKRVIDKLSHRFQ